MLKLIPLTALALGLSSGVASADHRGGDRWHGGNRTVVERRQVTRDWRGGGGGGYVARDRGGYWRGGGRVIVRDRPYYGGYGYHNVVRRPIFVSRPIIRHRYFDYYRRPALVVENYAPMSGYYWVPGHWEWSGYEWIWQPGHYQPDPNYVDPGYDGYDYDSY